MANLTLHTTEVTSEPTLRDRAAWPQQGRTSFPRSTETKSDMHAKDLPSSMPTETSPPSERSKVRRVASTPRAGSGTLPRVGRNAEVGRKPVRKRQVHRATWSLETGFTFFGFVVAVFLLLTFGLDLAFGWPFDRCSLLMDIGYLICAILLAYLSWDTYRGLR